MKVTALDPSYPSLLATGTTTGTSVGGDVGGTLPGGTTVVGIGGSPIVGTPAATNVIQFDGTNWVYVDLTAGLPPYYIAPTETYSVPIYKQALFTMIIDVAGILDVAGYLIDVA